MRGCMQFDFVNLPPPLRPRPTRTRLVGMSNGKTDTPIPQNTSAEDDATVDIPMQPTQSMEPMTSIDKEDSSSFKRTAGDHKGPPGHSTPPSPLQEGFSTRKDEELKEALQVTLPFVMNGKGPTDLLDDDISRQRTANLMQLSGMLKAIRTPRQDGRTGNSQSISNDGDYSAEEGYWPYGIQQTGPLPVVNLYGSEPFGRTFPYIPAGSIIVEQQEEKQQPAWKAFLSTPAAKVTIGLIVGVGLLLLVARFVNLPATILVLRQNLATPRGITLALLSGVAFLLAWCVRGLRWKLFLNPVGKVSTLKAIGLYQVGVFLNFLLPIRGGEVAKCFILKRSSNIAVSQSLPTVAMDKALDLLPALVIMVLVPLLGIHMDIKLWLVLAFVGGILLSLLCFVGLAAWKRNAAIGLLQKLTRLLPQAIASKIEGFATGFVDSLLMGARQPRIFVPALLLTGIAVLCDGLFAMLAFWTIGFPIPFGTAIFGYAVYNMFYILPTPPGQVGSNEAVGLLVFSGLLKVPPDQVAAMFVFSHPWAALLMCAAGLACLSALGLTISSAMKLQAEGDLVAGATMGPGQAEAQ